MPDPAFADLVVRYLDDALSESQCAEFNRRLLDDDTLRRYFWITCRVAAQRHDYGREPSVPAVPAKPLPIYRKGHEPNPNSETRIPKAAIAFSIAAALLVACGIAIYVLTLNPEPSPPDAPEPSTAPLANLIENASDGTLTTPGGFISEGRDYGRGEYALDTGTAEFMLTNSVNVKLHGETRMSMHNDMNVSLTRGSAAFVVPAGAEGFTVHLPDGSHIVDLGTAFRVDIDDTGRASVRVTRGKVAWHAADTATPPVELAAGTIAQRVEGRVHAAQAPPLVAYHDFGGDPSPGYITTQRTLDETIRLVDHTSGSETEIELTINGDPQIDGRDVDRRGRVVTRPPAPGTPGHQLFAESKIDLGSGYIGAGKESSGRMALVLTGLDPTRRYDLALYGDRNFASDGAERFTLNGADDATNASTSGIVNATTTDLETRPNAEAGHVVRWTNIDPGDDGMIEIEIDPTIGPELNLAYISALRLAAVATPEPAEPAQPDTPAATDRSETSGP